MLAFSVVRPMLVTSDRTVRDIGRGSYGIQLARSR